MKKKRQLHGLDDDDDHAASSTLKSRKSLFGGPRILLDVETGKARPAMDERTADGRASVSTVSTSVQSVTELDPSKLIVNGY